MEKRCSRKAGNWQCGRFAKPNRSRCEECTATCNRYQREAVAERKEAGLCIVLGCKVPPNGKSLCNYHREQRKKQVNKHDKKRRNGVEPRYRKDSLQDFDSTF